MSTRTSMLTQSQPPRRAISTEEKPKTKSNDLDLIRHPQHSFEMVIGQVCARDISHDALSESATEVRPDTDGHEGSATAVGVVVGSEMTKNDVKFADKPMKNSDIKKWENKK